MRNERMDITIFSILVAALLGALVTFTLFILMLVPLALLIKIFAG